MIIKFCPICQKKFIKKERKFSAQKYCSKKCFKQKKRIDYLKFKYKKQKYYQNNRIKILKQRKKYYKINKIKIIKQKRKYYNKKLKTDISFKLRHYLSKRIWDALRHNYKSLLTIELLSCSIEFLKQHLEKQFIKGMSWFNYGKWHIDHIRPCASFDLRKKSEQRKCFHYTNLQPLWAKDNLKKSDDYKKY